MHTFTFGHTAHRDGLSDAASTLDMQLEMDRADLLFA